MFGANLMPRICVIFDLDGTLVDSEGLCNQAFLDLIPQMDDTVESLISRYRGRELAWILTDIQARLDEPLPGDFVQKYRVRVAELFSSGLKPTLGAREMLQDLQHPRCIASSGPVAKIRQALSASGLEAFFGDHIFSSYEVNSWKPAPELFLHAADAMGFLPDECVVVEDSAVGIQAAGAAGMHALHYMPHHFGAHPNSFQSMTELPCILDRLIRNA